MADRQYIRDGLDRIRAETDCFIAAVRFMEGGAPTPWWHYTAERKQRFTCDPGAAG